ncbi:hypothetical protein BV898_01021 [Hypsibius exemplaris]|uniref:Sperm microtubule inner protein 1 C-terminal domain-containing protein n=1 Tax=Hypsibius exemplaris TaxID=2072580 RepID=A0A1W0XD96_HYPEX|nr:hypothetical protein BV898_01021 [Hypsibius exemplaris]
MGKNKLRRYSAVHLRYDYGTSQSHCDQERLVHKREAAALSTLWEGLRSMIGLFPKKVKVLDRKTSTFIFVDSRDGRPSDARKIYIGEAQIEHDKVVRLAWQNKYGRILDQSTEKIGRVTIVKPVWWKLADVHVSEQDKIPREIDQLMTIMKFPPKRRRFPPHKKPGPEITEHLPSLSMQFPVPPEQQAILKEYEGRLVYLKRRSNIPLNQRFVQAPNVNANYGWDVLKREHLKGATENKYDHKPVLADEFYRSAGVINARKNSTILDITAN